MKVKSTKDTLLRPADASRELCVSSSTLRRYETEGKIKSARTSGGHRRYLASEIERFKNQTEPRAGDDDYTKAEETIAVAWVILTIVSFLSVGAAMTLLSIFYPVPAILGGVIILAALIIGNIKAFDKGLFHDIEFNKEMTSQVEIIMVVLSALCIASTVLLGIMAY